MKKPIHIITTILIMLIVSRFIIRIVDATVQIDDDVAMLILLVVAVNVFLAFCSYKL